MRPLTSLVLALLMLCQVAQAAEKTPTYQSKRLTTPEDTAAIHKVLDHFALAIATRDPKLLGTLVLHPRILFASPGNQAWVDRVRKYEPRFDGLEQDGYLAFARFVGTSKVPIAENFYNVQITQDGVVAWALFDYEFIEDGKLSNYGTEHWQLRKTDGEWKIFSIVWTSYDPPTPAP